MKTVPSAAVASNALFIEAPRLTPKNDSTPPFATVCCFRNIKVEINRPPLNSAAAPLHRCHTPLPCEVRRGGRLATCGARTASSNAGDWIS